MKECAKVGSQGVQRVEKNDNQLDEFSWGNPGSSGFPGERDIDVIALDLDGTLLRSDGSLSDYTKGVVKEVASGRIPVLLVTGRGFYGSISVYRELNLETPLICYNGALICEGASAKVLDETFLEAKDVKEALLFNRNRDGLHMRACTRDWLYEEDPPSEEFQEMVRGDNVVQCDFGSIDLKKFNKLTFIGHSYQLQEMKLFLDSAEGRPFETHHTSGHFLDALPRGVSKGSGVKWFLRQLNLSFQKVLAFGDELNDTPLLASAAYGVAMANGRAELKEITPFTTDYTNDEDGVARFLERCFLKGAC